MNIFVKMETIDGTAELSKLVYLDLLISYQDENITLPCVYGFSLHDVSCMQQWRR